MRSALAIVIAALMQTMAPQNPSPMSDTTRPHPRIAPYEPKGQRLPVGQGTLFVREGLTPSRRMSLVVHFHGAPWLVEHHVSTLKHDIALVTFQLGAGSAVYAKPFADPAHFDQLLVEAADGVSKLRGRPTSFDRIVLTSWSAGYGSIRAILRQEHYARISSVMLLDSMHASYAATAVAGPRAQDLPVLPGDLDAFARLAGDAVAGRKTFVIAHSEVFPGTYASTTETADAILRAVSLHRRPVLREGPIGMQQLSETTADKLAVIGYAGNSAPDHVDHLYAWADLLTRWRVLE